MTTKMYFSNIIFISLFVVNIAKVITEDSERDIHGKIIVITGGNRGIGYGIAENFLKNGAKTVVLLTMNVASGEEAARTLNSKYGEDKADFIECDITKDLEKVYEILMKKYKYVDVLVNNAAIFNKDLLEETIQVNTVAPMKWTYKFLELMRKDKNGKGGTIMNMATTLIHEMNPAFVIYRTSKIAVLGFTRSLGHEYNYKRNGVRILILCPGLTNTTMSLSIATTYTEEEQRELSKFVDYSTPQSADDVGKATIDIFKDAKTGTSWDIVGGKPFESTYVVTITEEKKID